MSEIPKIQVAGVAFHGGCHGCTQQAVHDGPKFCMNCQFFNADWSKENLNNRPKTKAEIIRAKLLAGEDV